jgi:hypothetical protein
MTTGRGVDTDNRGNVAGAVGGRQQMCLVEEIADAAALPRYHRGIPRADGTGVGV